MLLSCAGKKNVPLPLSPGLVPSEGKVAVQARLEDGGAELVQEEPHQSHCDQPCSRAREGAHRPTCKVQHQTTQKAHTKVSDFLSLSHCLSLSLCLSVACRLILLFSIFHK